MRATSFLGFDVDPAACDLLKRAAVSAWKAVTMKLGFASLVSAAVGTSALLTAAAQCPDYTTFSQVCRAVARTRREGLMRACTVEPAGEPFDGALGIAVHAP